MDDKFCQKASICIVNYKTLDLTRLCLRSIRKFTEYLNYEVIVVDNNSNDASVDYLRSLDWIKLIERQTVPGESGGEAHARALQTGLDNCDSEFFVSLHSDCVIVKKGWLKFLIDKFRTDNTACVGAGKLEMSPQWRIALKKITDLRTFRKKLFKEPDPLLKLRYYNRTVCTAYKAKILKGEKLTFTMGQKDGFTAGKKLYFELVDRGFDTVELPDKIMKEYILHLAHATQVVNIDEFKIRNKTVRKCEKSIKKLMNSQIVKDLQQNSSLDE